MKSFKQYINEAFKPDLLHYRKENKYDTQRIL